MITRVGKNERGNDFIGLDIILGHEGEVTDLKFSHGAERLISCSVDRSFRVFDLTTGSEVYCRVLDQELK